MSQVEGCLLNPWQLFFRTDRPKTVNNIFNVFYIMRKFGKIALLFG